MIPVDQTILARGAGDITNGRNQVGNCWQAAVASAFEMPLDHVPHFWQEAIDAGEDDEGWSRYATFVSDLGWRLEWREAADVEWPAPVDCIIFGCGPSPRGVAHMVVLDRWGDVAHDPHPSRAGLLKLDYIEVLTRDPRPYAARRTWEPWLDAFWPKAGA